MIPWQSLREPGNPNNDSLERHPCSGKKSNNSILSACRICEQEFDDIHDLKKHVLNPCRPIQRSNCKIIESSSKIYNQQYQRVQCPNGYTEECTIMTCGEQNPCIQHSKDETKERTSKIRFQQCSCIHVQHSNGETRYSTYNTHSEQYPCIKRSNDESRESTTKKHNEQNPFIHHSNGETRHNITIPHNQPKQAIQRSKCGTTESSQSTSMKRKQQTPGIHLSNDEPRHITRKTDTQLFATDNLTDVTYEPYNTGICVCPLCQMYFSKYSYLARHLKFNHYLSDLKLASSDGELNTNAQTVTQIRLVCLDCYRYSSGRNKADLKFHFRAHDDGQMRKYKFCLKMIELDTKDSKKRVLFDFEQHQFYCIGCKRDFLSEEEFKAHERRHDKLMNCPLCGHQTSEADFIEHVETMHSSERDCGICKKKFIHHRRFMEHLLAQHTSGEMYKCMVCKKCFPHFTIFQNHIKWKHSGNVISHVRVCYVCGANYTRGGAFRQHIKTHATDLPRCDHCQRTFTAMGSLRSHVSIHFVGPRHKCNLCNKTFRTAIYLENHNKQVHTKELRFICERCGYRGLTEKNLKRHMLVHSRDKLFHCEKCGVRFRWPDNLRVHIKNGVCANS